MEKLRNLKKSILPSYFYRTKIADLWVFMFHEAENLKNWKNIFSLRRKNCRLRKVIKKGLEKFEESCINFLIFFILKS